MSSLRSRRTLPPLWSHDYDDKGRFKLTKESLSRAPLEYLAQLERADPNLPNQKTITQRYSFDSIVDFKRVMVVSPNRTWKIHNIVFVAVRPQRLEFKELSPDVRKRIVSMILEDSATRMFTVEESANVAPEENLIVTGDTLKSVTPCQDLIDNLLQDPANETGHIFVTYYPFPVNCNNLSAPAIFAVMAKLEELSKLGELRGTDSVRDLHKYSEQAPVYVQFYWNWTSIMLNYYRPNLFELCDLNFPNSDYFVMSKFIQNKLIEHVNSFRQLEKYCLLKVMHLKFDIKGTFKFLEILNFTPQDSLWASNQDMGEDSYLNTAQFLEVTSCRETEFDLLAQTEMAKCSTNLPGMPEDDEGGVDMAADGDAQPYVITLQSAVCPHCPKSCTTKEFILGSLHFQKHVVANHKHLAVQCPKCLISCKIHSFEVTAHDQKYHTLTSSQKWCSHCGRCFRKGNFSRHLTTCLPVAPIACTSVVDSDSSSSQIAGPSKGIKRARRIIDDSESDRPRSSSRFCDGARSERSDLSAIINTCRDVTNSKSFQKECSGSQALSATTSQDFAHSQSHSEVSSSIQESDSVSQQDYVVTTCVKQANGRSPNSRLSSVLGSVQPRDVEEVEDPLNLDTIDPYNASSSGETDNSKVDRNSNTVVSQNPNSLSSVANKQAILQRPVFKFLLKSGEPQYSLPSAAKLPLPHRVMINAINSNDFSYSLDDQRENFQSP